MRRHFLIDAMLAVTTLIAVFTPLTLQARAPDAESELQQVFADYWQYVLQDNPLFASARSDLRYNDLLRNESPEAYEVRLATERQMLERLQNIDRAQLSPVSQLNHDLFLGELGTSTQELEFETYLGAVHQRSGFHLSMPRMHERIPFQTEAHYRDYLKRLTNVPDLVAQTRALLQRGVERRITPPKLVLGAVPDQINGLLAIPLEDFPLYEPFQEMPAHIPPETREKLRLDARQIISEKIMPSFREFVSYFEDVYLPSASTEIAAASRHPSGKAFYDFRIRRFTTTDMTAREIHEVGLAEVKRIRDAMQKVIESTEFDGSFDDFVNFLRTDPQFYHDTPEELLTGYRDICKRMDAALPMLFGKLPRAPYGVREIPDYEAPQATTAYYSRASADGTRPGWFFANTYDLKSRPKYEMEALTFHEAVPGHHLQIALQQELEDVPDFRTLASYTAFVEGWALYSESLGHEVGFYTDPYSKFGALSYEMWRALRLVVDTGMHAFGWSRDRAIEFMLENSALTRTNVINEVDRYIAWPGQALAYKIGQMKIMELRRRAESELGENFDLRAFHDLILSAGAIPLDILERRVMTWLAGFGAN